MNALRDFLILKLVEILAPTLRDQVIQDQTGVILDGFDTNGLSDEEKAVAVAALNQVLSEE